MYNNYEQVERFFNKRKQFGIKLGLDRMSRLLSLLGNPQANIKGIHVAGTNGKGSTISYLENALINNSYHVGVFTSPSLTDLTGHIFLNGKVITKEKFVHVFNDIYPAIKQLDEEGNHPTEFEIITCLAFAYFAKNTHIALIEAGMGGSGDTTNCFDPILSIITNITKDHTNFLGNTITKIATEKSGIIKQNRPIITGEINEAAFKVIEREASAKQSQLYQLNRDFIYTKLSSTSGKQTFIWKSDDQAFSMELQMQGEHQIINSSLAMMALILLKKQGYMIDMNKSIKSIQNTFLPGRFEVMKKNPLIILDGAHNIAGMKAFLRTVQLDNKEREMHLIFAGFKDKDLQGMLEIVSPYFTSITLTTFDHPRAQNPEKLYDLVDNKHTVVAYDWKTIINKLIYTKSDCEGTYFITGSLNFISIVRSYIQKLGN